MVNYPNPEESSNIASAYSPDTIHFKQNRRWIREAHDNWNIKKTQDTGDQLAPITISAYHKLIKELHLRGNEVGPSKIILSSLSKLLYGHNGRIIRSDEEQAFAYELLNRVLNEITEPLETISAYSRFDVSFHCDINYSDIQELTRGLRPTNGRKAPSIKEGESIRFDCGDAQVEFYDKLRDMERHKYNVSGSRAVTRCEVRCRTSESVHKYFGPDLVEFGPCSKTLRDGVFKLLASWFPPVCELSRPTSIYEFLAQEEVISPGIASRYKSMFKPSTQKDVEMKVKKASRALFHERVPLFDMIRTDSEHLQVDVEPTRHGSPVTSKYQYLIDEIIAELDSGEIKVSDLGQSMHRFKLQ